MLAAIIAAIAAVVFLSVVITIVFFIRSRKRTPHVSPNGKMSVRSIDTVVSADPSQEAGSKQSATSRPSSANLTDALRSRFLIFGGFAAAVFGALFTRIGNMQIFLSDEYLSQAEENQYTTVSTPAPRGIIYDRDGIELVRNRTSLTVLADVEVAEDRTVVQRLSALLGIPHNVVKHRIEDATTGAQSQRVVASDVALRNVAFIVEHADAFPGVTTQSRTEREYPWGALAAHLLGYTGTITESGLANVADGREVEMGDTVGQSGIESAYDQILAGTHGQRVVIADADGTVQRVVSETKATKGNDIYLTISGPVQAVADTLLADLVAPVDGVIGTGSGDSASLVVMDVTDGSILAMASYPTFAPEAFVGGISTEIWELYSSEEAYNPLLNRVISGLYPAASTFKAFTGLAGLAYGFADTSRTWNCTGSWDYWETGSAQMCWLRSGHGYLNFRSGIVNSCDIVFYEIAKDFFEAAQNGDLSMTAMQEYIEKFGFGQTTGLDISGEQAGRVPTPEWKAEYWKNYPEDADWRGGDMTNLVIGQGDVLVTPLQIAVAYGGVATGKLMRPHLLKEVRNSDGEVVATYTPEVVSELDVPEENLAIMRDALHGVATENSTISALCSEYGIDAAGKTGTAENSGASASAWFVCYAPYDDPKYVVACQVDHGGAGSTVAGPVGVEMMATVLSYDEGELGESSMSVIAASTGQSIELQSTSSSRTD